MKLTSNGSSTIRTVRLVDPPSAQEAHPGPLFIPPPVHLFGPFRVHLFWPLTYAQSHEILIAEIFELVPTDEQEKFLSEMSKTESDNFVWVDEDRIRRRGAIPKQDYMLSISEHSQWIL